MLIKKVKNRLLLYSDRLKTKLRLHWYGILLKKGKFDNNNQISTLEFDEEWEGRIKKVVESEYNSFIPRSTNAGKIANGFQIMHNGLEVSTGDYYGLPIAKMLFLNKGVHEPEEEKMFLEVLRKMPKNPVMVEMGAYWAFYSMWFLRATENGKVYMIEPEEKNLVIGKKNFKKNNLTGSFDNYFIGKRSSNNSKVPTISMDDFISDKGLDHIDIAHCDIQGYEMEMLEGVSKSLKKQLIDYFFISTHTNELHYTCIEYLKKYEYKIVFHTDLNTTASFDGFILAISSTMTYDL